MPNSVFLYVEDDPFSRDIMQMIADNFFQGSQLYMLEDSTDFISKIDTLPQKPDLFLLDIHVEPYNGFDMLKLLREHPSYQDTKIIALTASVMNEEVEKLRISGFNGAIAKPLRLQTFPTLINRIFEGEAIWHIAN